MTAKQSIHRLVRGEGVGTLRGRRLKERVHRKMIPLTEFPHWLHPQDRYLMAVLGQGHSTL